MSDLSVLTLVKNRPSHLRRLVEGLRRSETAPLELIVVDMSEPPVEVEAAPDFPVTLIRFPTADLPLAQARNLAARQARGSRLLFLDVDCIPAAALVGRMEADLKREDALICASVGYLGAGEIDDDWTEAGLVALAASHPVRAFPPDGLRLEPNAGLFWSLTFGIRRGTFEALAGFDERFTGYGAEDTDFGFRCREAGLPLLFAGGAGSFHQHHGVFDPPLQHFDDIIRNARVFHDRWGVWPMESWLRSFESLGLSARVDQRLVRYRGPSPIEIEKARQPPGVRF